MYVCMYVCMYVSLYVCMYMHIHIYIYHISNIINIYIYILCIYIFYVFIYKYMYIYIHTDINNILIMYTYTPPPHPIPQGGAGRHTYIKTCGHTDKCTDTHDHDHLGGGGSCIHTPHHHTPFCMQFAAFLMSSLVFARYLQHFFHPATYFPGNFCSISDFQRFICNLLEDLYSTHTPSKYTYS